MLTNISPYSSVAPQPQVQFEGGKKWAAGLGASLAMFMGGLFLVNVGDVMHNQDIAEFTNQQIEQAADTGKANPVDMFDIERADGGLPADAVEMTGILTNGLGILGLLGFGIFKKDEKE